MPTNSEQLKGRVPLARMREASRDGRNESHKSTEIANRNENLNNLNKINNLHLLKLNAGLGGHSEQVLTECKVKSNSA